MTLDQRDRTRFALILLTAAAMIATSFGIIWLVASAQAEYAAQQQWCWDHGKGQAFISKFGSGCYAAPIRD